MKRSMRTSVKGFSSFLFLFSVAIMSQAKDIITSVGSMKDGETITSANGSFEMGFFTPGNSKNRYVGIWYKKISERTVVWVANREAPLSDSSGVLSVKEPGILVLLNGTKNIIWSSNTSKTVINSFAQLLDTGNLVVKDANENLLWESFHHPTDTLLPGMKHGRNFITGEEVFLSSWKSNDDPRPGDYTYHLDPTGYPQVVLLKGSVEQYRTGPWNGARFSGRPNMENNTIYSFGLVFNKEEVYYIYQLIDSTVITRITLSQTGVVQRWLWINRTQNWFIYLNAPEDNCDTYNLCGPYGSCNVGNSPMCGCLNKFQAKHPQEWVVGDWSDGCVRKTALDCRGDVFLKYSGIKLPDTRYSWFNRSMDLEECEIMCSKNCTCMGYAKLDIRDERSGCLLWFGDLIDIREQSKYGQDIFIRMASSELGNATVSLSRFSSKGNKRAAIVISMLVLVGVVLLGLALAMYIKKRKKNMQQEREGRPIFDMEQDYTNKIPKEDLELPIFDLSTIVKATDNFSFNNKLGEGGFGPVYQGILEEGREIAVKRLSRTSTQGLNEFKNEVICIAKHQHRNLVKLVGCCIQEEEKMLIYEYLPNKSLDLYIFENPRKLLDWHRRFHIINGISRGLLYLHQDSRLRIIHRDLKASNVLLDMELNPKISDFGLARVVEGNETESNTNRVVGTYGYMSPEYAIDGLFSVKSDVFSFGVLVLEIVSGKRNRKFIHRDHQHNLLGHSWRLHKEGRSEEMIDSRMGDSHSLTEVLRCIHVGLLCVQQGPEDRPDMSSVVLMLGSKGLLPQPKQPGFFAERTIFEIESSSNTRLPGSSNEFTVSLLDPR